MDSFDNFQYESASSYGGAISVVDDNSSVYADSTHARSVDLSSLSGDQPQAFSKDPSGADIVDDFDAVLDDLKDEGTVDLPPHACRYVG